VTRVARCAGLRLLVPPGVHAPRSDGRIGPIVAARRAALVESGLMAEAQVTDTLAIITARRPLPIATPTRRAA